MKISKVDNTRFAVVPAGDVTGKLYKDPKEKDRLELMKHINSRIEKAGVLYAALIDKKLPGYCKKYEKDVVRNFNTMLKTAASQKDAVKQRELLQNPDKIKDKKGYPMRLNAYKPNKGTIEGFAGSVVRSALRKGLKDQQEFIIDMLGWFCQPDVYKKMMQAPEQQERIKTFLAVLNEDYWKLKQKESICKSLEQQDVKVQVINAGGQQRLALSSYRDIEGESLKVADKAALFRFMQEYANNPEALKRILYEYVDRFFDISADEVKLLELESVLPGGIPSKMVKRGRMEYETADYGKAKELLGNWLRDRYRAAVKTSSEDKDAAYWYQQIQKCLENYFSSKEHLIEEKLTKKHLVRIVQGHLSHYIMGKYMDLGKAVYHFCDLDTPDIRDCGQILPQYQQPRGITSFDYEYIKAEEKLEKDLSVSLVYAISNFRQNVLQGQEEEKDFLLPDQFEQYMKAVSPEKLHKELLRYWGGESSVEVSGLDSKQLAEEVHRALYYLRNYSFHYGTQQQDALSFDVLRDMMQMDSRKYSVSVYQKYLNNNVFGFYNKEDVCGLIKNLHSASKYTPSFVPAFASVFKRKQMADYMNQNKISVEENGTGAEQFRSALYFVLKDIYYYQFLREDKQVLEYFRQVFAAETEKLKKECSAAETREKAAGSKRDLSREEKSQLQKETKSLKTRLKAMENFAKTINMDGKGVSFGQICQRALMTYALNNNTNYRDAAAKEEKETFAHYKMILTKLLYQAFIQYMQENPAYDFLKKPLAVRNENLDTEAMLKSFADTQWHLKEYDNLFAQEQSELEYAYYIMGKLLPPKQLNLLVGDLKNYQQFTEDIERRSGYAESSIQLKKQADYRKLTEIMQFCLLSSGQISNNFKDYYQDKNEYASYLRGFVEFEDSGQNLPYADLEIFCQDVANGDSQNNHLIYVDGQNPVLYRGVEMARMYGMDQAVRNALENRVTKADIERLKKLTAKDLKNVLAEGKCKTAKEQKLLKQYQNLKQKVELNDIQTYSDIVFDLYSQLISWCYMHERDQLYLLIGYHYVKQYWPVPDAKPVYPMLQNICNAYRHGYTVKFSSQIASSISAEMYDCYTMVKKDVKDIGMKKELNTKTKCERLKKWFGEDVFAVEGLKKDCRDKMQMPASNSDFRNYVDHFEYFRKQDISLLQMYQNVFYYMGYDRKLQNAVVRKLETVLERYFLFTNIVWEKADKGYMLICKQPAMNDMTTRFGKLPENEDRSIPDDAVLTSQWLTYGIESEGKKEQVCVDARTQKFCKNVHNILTYKK